MSQNPLTCAQFGFGCWEVCTEWGRAVDKRSFSFTSWDDNVADHTYKDADHRENRMAGQQQGKRLQAQEAMSFQPFSRFQLHGDPLNP